MIGLKLLGINVRKDHMKHRGKPISFRIGSFIVSAKNPTEKTIFKMDGITTKCRNCALICGLTQMFYIPIHYLPKKREV